MDYSNLSDKTIIELIAHGDENAIGSLLDRYGGLTYSIAFEFTRDGKLAEEVVQEVFTQIWLKASTFNSERGIAKVWISSIVRYQAIDTLRRRNARPAGNSISLDDMYFNIMSKDPSPEDAALQSLTALKLREAITELPESQRQALSLAYYQGYTHREIANLLNIPLGTVKTRIRSALQRLRRVLWNLK